MKPPHFFLLLILPLALSAAEPARRRRTTPSTPPPPHLTPVERRAEINQHIDALFKLRTDSTPYAAGGPNPFRLPTDATFVAAPVAARAEFTLALNDAELLPRLAAGLRVGGLIELGDTRRVIINQRNYREGDTLPVSYQDQPFKLLVKSLTTENFVLVQNQAELAIRLKKAR